MIYPVFSIRDLKGDFYSPRIDQNEVSAVRWFAQMVNTPDTTINFSPRDFQFFRIGDFDSESGRLIPLDLPQLVSSAIDVYGKE